MRRNLLWMAAILPVLLACAGSRTVQAGTQGRYGRSDRLHGIPVGTLRLDANPDKRGVTIYDDKGYRIDAGSLVSLKVVGNAGYPGGEQGLPTSIRATWLTGQFSHDSNGGWIGGTLAGDYTVPVAERIPDAVLDFIRTKGGSLRLKIRVVDNGVLIGWDVEKIVSVNGWKPGNGPSGIHHYLPGGDFREDQIENGVVIERGWQNPPPATGTVGQSKAPDPVR